MRAPDVDFRVNGGGSGGRRAGVLESEGFGVMWSGGRGCRDARREWRRDPNRLGAPEGLVLGGHRLPQSATICVVGSTVGFDVRDVGEGVVAGHMKESGIGQRHAEGPEQEEPGEERGAEPDSETGHGWNVPGRAGEDKTGGW